MQSQPTMSADQAGDVSVQLEDSPSSSEVAPKLPSPTVQAEDIPSSSEVAPKLPSPTVQAEDIPSSSEVAPKTDEDTTLQLEDIPSSSEVAPKTNEDTTVQLEDIPSSSKLTPKTDEDNTEPYTFCVFTEESQLTVLKSLIENELSEPYTLYTYRFFAYNWPDLCIFAMEKDRYVGVVVCKLEMLLSDVQQGYIAMLAVDVEYRKRGIGRSLAKMAIEMMAERDAAIVVLETEISNKAALALYESLGFIRERRMMNYYMNGMDAFRLKLVLDSSMDLHDSED